MRKSQTQVTRHVRRYIDAEGLTVSELARHLGMSRGKLRDRLVGRCRWQIEDLDRLCDAGILEWDVEAAS